MYQKTAAVASYNKAPARRVPAGADMGVMEDYFTICLVTAEPLRTM